MIVRPIRFTNKPEEHVRICQALGGRLYGRSDAPWVIVAFGQGRVAFHVPHGENAPGSVKLGFEVPDVVAWAAETGFEVTEARQGPSVAIAAGDGQTAMVDNATPGVDDVEGSSLAVAPLWYTPDVPGAQKVLEGLGGALDITSNSGTWADYRFDSGRVAAHIGERVGAELSFYFDGDIEALRERVEAAGISARIIDEGYGRSLRIADPDAPDEDIFINEQQSDLYGYEKH
ncbi:hypothetical protein VR010_04775 [Actinomycetaceae bacterium L2_0104]